jgi:hypothetical protein
VGRREQRLVWLALAVVAVAIVDDAFLRPEPGTTAADHIVSGLVSLAVVGVVAAVYPRMRTGARAAVGVIVGALGDFNAFGWDGEPDLRAAIGFLERRPDVDSGRIGGLGLSVGGELLLQTAAHDSRLHAVISERAGVRSLAEQLDTPGVPGWIRPLSPWLVQTAALAVLSDGMPPPGLGDLVRDIDRPVLLIQARSGQGGEELNADYAANGGRATTRWTAAGGHTGALAAEPREYERRVIDFLDRALSAHTPNPSRR